MDFIVICDLYYNVVGSYSLLAVVVSSAIVWHAGRLLVVVASLVCNVASVHDCLVLVYFGASAFLFMFFSVLYH